MGIKGTLRTFIALPLTPELQLKLAAIQDKLKQSRAEVKWVAPENIHLTLKFLGYVSEHRLKDIFKAADEAIDKEVNFLLSLSGLGAFPKLDNPRVVWVGVKEGKEALVKIYRNLEESFKRQGFPEEAREYHPHLTLGRVKSSKNKDKLIEIIRAERNYSLGSLKAEKIVVFQSILKPEGPEYKALHTSQMKGK